MFVEESVHSLGLEKPGSGGTKGSPGLSILRYQPRVLVGLLTIIVPDLNVVGARSSSSSGGVNGLKSLGAGLSSVDWC